MITVAEALSKIVGGVAPLGSESVSIVDAPGRVLSAEVTARITQPFADVSSMDGYAVRAAEVTAVPVDLTVVGESAAGRGFDGTLAARQATRIFTGAPLPAGADAVVIQEVADRNGDIVTVKESSAAGRWVRRAGMDFNQGDVLLSAGTVLTARDIGLIAAMNVPWVQVARRPRVALLATGDELVLPGDAVGPDQIISSNSLALGAAVTAMGGIAIDLGIARDNENSLHQMVAGAAGADLLVTIGGASVGDYDLVQQVLGAKGLDLSFYKVAMQPGKPLIFGTVGQTPVLGLPGNPVSALVTAHIFVRAAIERILGIDRTAQPMLTAALARDVKAGHGRQEYMRATLTTGPDGTLVADPFELQDSSLLARLAKADCLLIRPPHAPAARAGERAEIIPLATGITTF